MISWRDRIEWYGLDWFGSGYTRWWTFGFHKMLGSSSVVAQLAVYRKGLSSMELVPLSLLYLRLHVSYSALVNVSCYSMYNVLLKHSLHQPPKKLYGLSPRANYTDRATAACRRSDCQLLRIQGAHGLRGGSLRPYFRFSRQELLLFCQVAPQLYSRGWVDPVPDTLLFYLIVPGIEPANRCSLWINGYHLRPDQTDRQRGLKLPWKLQIICTNNKSAGLCLLIR
jgi:hypothetical protein